MNAGSSLFLRLHPRLIQLLTVTPVRSTVSSSQLKDGNPTLDYDDGAAREDEGSREKWTLAHVLAVGSNDTKVVEKERREFGVDYMLDVIAVSSWRANKSHLLLCANRHVNLVTMKVIPELFPAAYGLTATNDTGLISALLYVFP